VDLREVYGEGLPGETFRVLKEKEIKQFGHPKLWVYRHMCGHGRQTAEDHKEQFFGIIRLAYYKSGFFIRMAR
jgi:hypothetical protein